MSLRVLTRIGGLALGLVLSSPLLWPTAGPWPLLTALGLLAVTGGYLFLAAGGGRASRWQVRYRREKRQADGRLDAVLRFLADRAGHILIEANSQGLFLEAPVAFDRYIQVQLERVLPRARLNKVGNNSQQRAGGGLHLCLDPLAGDPLAWAAGAAGRRVQLHLHRGAHATLTAWTARGAEPPGRWLRLPGLRLGLGRRLPVWDELAVGVRPSQLLPASDGVPVFSSRSRLLQMAPPDGYRADGGRLLGEASDGRPLSLTDDQPLFTVGAPPSFLVRQALDDLTRGWAVVVVSSRRPVLDLIARQAGGMTHWLDQENARASAHLAVVSAGEWAGQDVETAIQLSEAFLVALGLDLRPPAVGALVRHLVRILAASAKATDHDLAFTDLYAISQGAQTLRAFLADLQSLVDDLAPEARESIRYLSDQLGGGEGYVQVVTTLSLLRAVLRPLRGGAVHLLCQPPFLNVGQALGRPGLLLVPLTNTDYPQNDRFVAAMLALALDQARAANPELRLALHLHDPHLYCEDDGRRWVAAARQDPRLSLLLDVQNPDRYTVRSEGGAELIFRCSEGLAAALAAGWDLGSTAAELADLPAGTALDRLPGLPAPVTLTESR